MAKFRKKPVVIDAFVMEADNIAELQKFVSDNGDDFDAHFDFIDQGCDGAALKVKTLEGTSYDVTPSDVIIRGVKGEYYPCKKDIFESTYELVHSDVKLYLHNNLKQSNMHQSNI